VIVFEFQSEHNQHEEKKTFCSVFNAADSADPDLCSDVRHPTWARTVRRLGVHLFFSPVVTSMLLLRETRSVGSFAQGQNFALTNLRAKH
jgi:hypothetical protein